MKDHKSDMRGPALKSKPVMNAGRDTSRPEAKSAHPIKSSAPSDPHTLGRVKSGEYLK